MTTIIARILFNDAADVPTTDKRILFLTSQNARDNKASFVEGVEAREKSKSLFPACDDERSLYLKVESPYIDYLRNLYSLAEQLGMPGQPVNYVTLKYV